MIQSDFDLPFYFYVSVSDFYIHQRLPSLAACLKLFGKTEHLVTIDSPPIKHFNRININNDMVINETILKVDV